MNSLCSSAEIASVSGPILRHEIRSITLHGEALSLMEFIEERGY